jgi:predicted membrane protein
MGKPTALGALIIAFSGSTIAGSIIGVLALKLLDRAGLTKIKHDKG